MGKQKRGAKVLVCIKSIKTGRSYKFQFAVFKVIDEFIWEADLESHLLWNIYTYIFHK